MELDVLVIGAGPAGSSCAATLAKAGAKVAIVHPGREERFRVGETINPAAREPLALLGIDPFDCREYMLPCEGVVSHWGSAGPAVQNHLFNPFGNGWRIDRAQFDLSLRDAARRAGAFELIAAAGIGGIRQIASGWAFSFLREGHTVDGRAGYVVEATGRRSVSQFAAHPGRLRVDRLVAFATRQREASAALQSRAHFLLIEAVPSGWWYSVHVPGDHLITVFLTDSDLLPRAAANRQSCVVRELRHAPNIYQRCAASVPTIEDCVWRGFDAATGVRRCVSGRAWTAVGDALMSFDPLAGQGILEALKSGISTANLLLTGARDSAHFLSASAEHASRFNAHLIQRCLIYSAEDRWPDSPFWRRRQSESPIAAGHRITI